MADASTENAADASSRTYAVVPEHELSHRPEMLCTRIRDAPTNPRMEVFSLPDDLVFARVIHIFGAIIWVGGLVFLMAVAVPFARSLPPESRVAAVTAMGRRYRPIAWSALVMLTSSGIYTMVRMHLFSWILLTRTGYGRLLLFKIVLVTIIIALTALHDFVLGPRAHTDTSSRSTMIALARTSGALTLVVPVIGVVLAH